MKTVTPPPIAPTGPASNATPNAAQNPAAAVALMVTATMFIAGTMLAAKALGSDALGPPLHALQISQGRFVFAFIGLLGLSLIHI